MEHEYTVTNTGDSNIRVRMKDGWRTVPPGSAVTGVLYEIETKPQRMLYRQSAQED